MNRQQFRELKRVYEDVSPEERASGISNFYKIYKFIKTEKESKTRQVSEEMQEQKNDQELLKQYGRTARKVLDIIKKAREEKKQVDKKVEHVYH